MSKNNSWPWLSYWLWWFIDLKNINSKTCSCCGISPACPGLPACSHLGPLFCSGLCSALAAQLPVLPWSEVTFLAPVTRPDKVVCVGMNYVDHCKEQNVPVPKEPIIFSKFASSIVGPYDEVILPPESQVGASPWPSQVTGAHHIGAAPSLQEPPIVH